MIRYVSVFLLLFTASFVWAQTTVHQLSFDSLEKKLAETNDSLVVVNFWATWCKPCIEELPYFEKLNKEYSSQKIKVILVNLDFNSKVVSMVEPFVKRKNLQSEILHITDTDPNTWINKIDSTWSGAIPATVVYNAQHGKIKFVEGQLTFDELEKIVQSSRKN